MELTANQIRFIKIAFALTTYRLVVVIPSTMQLNNYLCNIYVVLGIISHSEVSRNLAVCECYTSKAEASGVNAGVRGMLGPNLSQTPHEETTLCVRCVCVDARVYIDFTP